MKKFLMIVLVIALALMVISADTLKLVRITIVNKSGYEVYAKLQGVEIDQQYYLTIPKGTKDYPETKVYTILPDTYRWQITYSMSEGSLVVPIGEEYRELEIYGRLKVTLLAPTFYYNDCDADNYRLDQLINNPNCGVNYFHGEDNNLKFVPLGMWYLKNY